MSFKDCLPRILTSEVILKINEPKKVAQFLKDYQYVKGLIRPVKLEEFECIN